jgi:hypothetical protein
MVRSALTRTRPSAEKKDLEGFHHENVAARSQLPGYTGEKLCRLAENK